MELLEREIQLDQLSARLAAAAKGQGSMVLIASEAGAGKTSLVRAFASGTSKGSLALFGACDPLTTPRALGPLLDVVANRIPASVKSPPSCQNPSRCSWKSSTVCGSRVVR